MLITRCPNCATTFRVRMEQLNLRGGRVRCGHCHIPFSALASLEELPEDTPVIPMATAPQAAPQTPPANVATAPAPVAAPAPAPTPAVEAEDPIAAIDLPPTPLALHREEPAAPAPTENAGAVITQIVPLDDTNEDLDFDIEVDDDANGHARPAQQEPRLAAAAPPVPHEQDQPDEASKEFIELGSAADDDAEAFDRELEEHREETDDVDTTEIPAGDEDDGDGVPQLHTVFLDEDIPPGADIDPAIVAERKKKRRVLILTNLLLLITGSLLATYVLRVELTRLYPGLRAPLEQACQALSCDVPYPRDADEVLLVGSDLTQASGPPGSYHLAVTVRNHARYPVAWPQLEITLTDRFERALMRRVLEPKEWLPADVSHGPAFEAQGELTSQIMLSSDAPVMGYRLGVFYR